MSHSQPPYRWACCALPILLSLFPACGDDENCGPEESAAMSIDLEFSTSTGSQSASFSDWRSSPNNDCGESGGPTSLTVEGGDDGNSIVFCIPRPDKISGQSFDISETSRIQLIDLFLHMDDGACPGQLDRMRATTGTVEFFGVCADGQDPAGYSMNLALTIPLQVDCGTGPEESSVNLQGNIQLRSEGI